MVRTLLTLYYPFVILVTGVSLCLAVALLALMLLADSNRLLVLPALLLLVTAGHLLITFWLVLRARIRDRDWMELRLPREKLQGLYDLVDEVAEEREQAPPDEIRLCADDIAHVYESSKGKKILVLGGVAIAAFPQEALAGVIAHELMHFHAGDTEQGRRALRRQALMAYLDYQFRRQVVAWLNPMVWLLFLYHLAFRWADAGESRQAELQADRESVRQVGKETTAAALIYITVTEELPWAKLGNVVEMCASLNEPMTRVFATQVKLAQATTRAEWDEACQKALRKPTGLFDSHPALKDRLAAIGVKPRQALDLALDRTGPPARKLIDNWSRLEKELSDRLIAPYREAYLAKMDMAQIILGRPIAR